MEGNDRGSHICCQCHKTRTRYPRCVETPYFPFFPGILVDPERFIGVMDHWRTPHIGVPSLATSGSEWCAEMYQCKKPGHAFGGACHNTDKTMRCWNSNATAYACVPRVSGLGRLFVVLRGSIRQGHEASSLRTCPPSVHSHSHIFRFPIVYGGSLYPRCYSDN